MKLLPTTVGGNVALVAVIMLTWASYLSTNPYIPTMYVKYTMSGGQVGYSTSVITDGRTRRQMADRLTEQALALGADIKHEVSTKAEYDAFVLRAQAHIAERAR